jgi:hypothetical protein
MTIRHIRAHFDHIGMVIAKRDGEYRVNYAQGSESTAYYTDSPDDAYRTGLDMARRTAPCWLQTSYMFQTKE